MRLSKRDKLKILAEGFALTAFIVVILIVVLAF